MRGNILFFCKLIVVFVVKYAILCSVNKTFLRKLPAVHRVVWRSAHPLYNELLCYSFRREPIMDANRYFDAMHNAMSAQHPGAQLLLTVKLQDTCGNDACLS